MQYSLNFLWRQAVSLPVPGDGDKITCPIPQDLIANVREIAEYYPKIPLGIWVDIYGVGQNSSILMDSLTAEESASNIKFYSLDTVKKYFNDPLFKRPFDGYNHMGANIWEQIDFAKNLVIDRVLELSGVAAIFSDMDMNLKSEEFTRALSILEREGAVVGESIVDNIPNLENQFFGFSQKRQNFLGEVLAYQSAEEVGEPDEYTRFIYSFDPEVAEDYGIVRERITTGIPKIPNWRAVKDSYQKPHVP